MKTNRKIKNLICYVAAFALAIAANMAFFRVEKPVAEIYAANENTITLTNPSFSDAPSSTYPFNPSSYTKTSQNTNIDAGVINVEETKYSSRFENLAPISLADKYVLMIDSKDIITNYGYTTNNTINLPKAGNYVISVNVYTAEGGNAELKLMSQGEEFASINNIISDKDWTTCYFLVKNNDIENANLTLGMYLNGSGVVMFDDIQAYPISEKDLNDLRTSKEESQISLTDNSNKNFIKEISLKNLSLKLTKGENSTTTDVVKDSDGKYEDAFIITNTKKTYSTFETLSFDSSSLENETLTFEQNSIYKVTINAKTTNLVGSASLKLVQIVDEEEQGVDGSISLSSSKVTNVNNGYTPYSFYIKSSPLKTANYKLVVEFGTETSKASGSILLSSLRITRVTDSMLPSSSTSSETKIDLTSKLQTEENTLKTLLSNGKFNFISNESYSKQYPATPTGWTVTTGENDQDFGVVNTTDAEFSKLNELKNITNPYNQSYNNNVLMMHNSEADTLSYTSTAKTGLAEKSIHKFEANINTQNSPLTISLVTKIENKEVVLSSLTVDTDYEWKTVALYVKLGYQPLDISVKFTLDSSSWAYAYIDDVKIDYAGELSEDAFNAIQTGSLISKTDLTNIISGKANSSFENTNLFNGVGENIISGVVGVQNGPISAETFQTTNAETVLGIRALTEGYYTYTSNIGFKLASGSDKFYKISVDVYTQYLELAEESEENKLGVGIKLSNFEDSFTNVISNNKWTTYTFYINPSAETTTYIEFTFGSEQLKMMGDAFFGNIEFVENVTEKQFKNAKNTATTKVLKTVEEDSTEEPTKKDSFNWKDINWWYFASSSIFALALVVCLVGIVIRKIKFKKPVKKTKNSYDRNKTVSKQYYMRKATTERENTIRELEKDLEKLHNERSKFEDEYKQNLGKLRELKIKRATAAEISKVEKDLKKNQKMSASIGITINKITQEISYVKTDAYLHSLMRKLASSNIDNNKQS